METLYIIHENCYVHAESKHLRLTSGNTTIATIPLLGVKIVTFFDNVQLSVPALKLLVQQGIDIFYLSKNTGKITAHVQSGANSNIELKLAQHATYIDMKKRVNLSRIIIAAKIQNQLSVIKKYKYHDTNPDFDNHIEKIKNYEQSLITAETINEIMGIEGIVAKCYWDCFKHLLKTPVFKKRAYHPAPDYVNALLNLSYGFLSNDIVTSLKTGSFDPEIGILHNAKNGRYALVYDIMEQFRAPFADAWVLSILNKNQIKPEHFQCDNNEWLLTNDGFKKFCSLYHQRVPSWRLIFREQVNKLKTSMLQGATYEPYVI